ncbi:MAG: hypothetical protein K8I82_20635 [Anaerolineae bacterium]|nr:hypothetical protein [Anaerolineae bacterium]
MGLDASVMCNCYRQGKTTPCPYPEYFHVDEDGFPALNLPYERHEDAFDAFESWLANCCDHPHMDYAAVFVTNWKGYQSFLAALGQVGWEHFPVLQAELPQDNQGLTTPEAAKEALRELELFRQKGNITKTFLIDSNTGAPLVSSTMTYGGTFNTNGRAGMNLGIDEKGFFIVDAWELHREMFRAMRFEQRKLESESLDKPPQFEFIDLDTGRKFVCTTPLKLFTRDKTGLLKQTYPQHVHVEERSVDVQYFGYILEPLTYIFSVSIETGNPVRWS